MPIGDHDGDLFPPDRRPLLPCPRCGRLPRLVTRTDVANCFAHYECRRWFRRCRRGPEATELRGGEMWARRAAAVKWNRSVSRFARAPQPDRTDKAITAVWIAGAVAAVVIGTVTHSDALATPGVVAILLWIHAHRRLG